MVHHLFEDLFENGKRLQRRVVAAFANTAAALLEQKGESKKRKQKGEWTIKWLFRWDEKRLYNNLVSQLRLEEQIE